MEIEAEKEKNFNKDMYKLYNMIIKINSMNQLIKEGWPIFINKNIEKKKDYINCFSFRK